ncbi:MAG: helical backbone metal receptor, partial [Nevskiales bacterium]
AVDASAVIELKPDLVIASNKTNAAALDAIRAEGIPVTVVQIGPTLESAFTGMEQVSVALGSTAIGKWVIRDNRRALQRLAGKFRNEAKKLRALCVVVDLERKLSIGGKDTAAATMLELGLSENVATNVSGYTTASVASSKDLQPDVIVTATQDLYDPEELIEMLSNAGLGNSPAVKNKRIVDMDGNLLLGMGPRIAAAAEQLADYMRQPEGNIGF